MPTFEDFLILALGALVALGAGALVVLLGRAGGGAAARALAAGELDAALAAGGGAERRDELFAAAVAAKHLGRFGRASELLGRLLADDPDDGEAWLERGLVATYAGDWEEAEGAFARTGALRSDLLESLTLHRAYLALAAGDETAARRLFEEIEIPLETKLTTDLGGGDLAFAEWFLQASALWRARGEGDKARRAWEQGVDAAPGSALPAVIARSIGAP